MEYDNKLATAAPKKVELTLKIMKKKEERHLEGPKMHKKYTNEVQGALGGLWGIMWYQERVRVGCTGLSRRSA